MQKDLQAQRLKMVLVKIEGVLKNQYSISQEEINKMATLKEEELVRMLQLEKELDQFESFETFRYQEGQHQPVRVSECGVLSHLDKQMQKNKQASAVGKVEGQENIQNVEYIRNVFVKYLEYLAQNNTKEIITIEHVLFTELKVDLVQKQRIDQLRR